MSSGNRLVLLGLAVGVLLIAGIATSVGVADGRPVGGVKKLEAAEGERVRFDAGAEILSLRVNP